jgi:hypothetical protein
MAVKSFLVLVLTILSFTSAFNLHSSSSNRIKLPVKLPCTCTKLKSELEMSMESKNGNGDSQRKGMKGYYVRPSRAIEKGGGFFVPGLEDGNIRFVTGSFISILVIFNHLSANSYSSTMIVSEVIAMGMGIFLIFQAFQSPDESDATKSYQETLSILIISSKDEKQARNYEFISREIIKTCQGVSYLLCLSPLGVVLEIGYPSRKTIASASLSGLYTAAESYSAASGAIPRATSNDNMKSLLAEFKDVGIIRGEGEVLWLIASNEEDAVKENLSWIRSLISASAII